MEARNQKKERKKERERERSGRESIIRVIMNDTPFSRWLREVLICLYSRNIALLRLDRIFMADEA